MNSDESSKNQSFPKITHSIPLRLFPLPPKPNPDFESVRELVGLFKQGPLETNRQFAERVFKAWQDYVTRKNAR
jgi:hypothetical protein